MAWLVAVLEELEAEELEAQHQHAYDTPQDDAMPLPPSPFPTTWFNSFVCIYHVHT